MDYSGVEKQLKEALEAYGPHSEQLKAAGGGHIDTRVGMRLLTQFEAGIRRSSADTYIRQFDRALEIGGILQLTATVNRVAAIAEALLADIEAGHLESIAGLAQAAVFSDFLEMAQHLSDEGYKDAAAVVAGSSLEGHLRQLAIGHGIAVEQTSRGVLKRKKADLLNSDLKKADAYATGDQESVTAWLDIRNNAAHGDYDKYTAEQVQLMIQSIRDFMTRVPV